MGASEHRSRLAIDPQTAWRRACSIEEVNRELWPLLRMRPPVAARGLGIDDAPLGSTIGRFWILLFGLVPVDFDDLCIVEVEAPRRFLERSRTAAFSSWRHERIIEPDEGEAGGCVLTDRLRFELRAPLRRLPGAERLATAAVRGLFAHRHRRLRSRDTVAR